MWINFSRIQEEYPEATIRIKHQPNGLWVQVTMGSFARECFFGSLQLNQIRYPEMIEEEIIKLVEPVKNAAKRAEELLAKGYTVEEAREQLKEWYA